MMAPATRTKNKTKHPAVPVMTPAAQRKAGIKAAPPPKPKKVTKDQTVRELKVHIATLENPNEETFSKEPLVCSSDPPHTCYVLTQNQFTKGSSPPLDEDEDLVMETGVSTEVDSNNYTSGGCKQTAKSGPSNAR